MPVEFEAVDAGIVVILLNAVQGDAKVGRLDGADVLDGQRDSFRRQLAIQ